MEIEEVDDEIQYIGRASGTELPPQVHVKPQNEDMAIVRALAASSSATQQVATVEMPRLTAAEKVRKLIYFD